MIIGGGYTGLSCALHLKERFADKEIILLEGARCGYGASGRNGGFCNPRFPSLQESVDKIGPQAFRSLPIKAYLWYLQNFELSRY